MFGRQITWKLTSRLILNGLITLWILNACTLPPDIGDITTDYPHDLEFVSGYSGEERLRGEWGVQQFRLNGSYAVLASPDYVVVDSSVLSPPDLVILDITDFLEPQAVATYDLGWQQVDDMIIQDNLVYLSSERDGLAIVDIADPVNPTLVSKVDHKNNNATALAVVGDYLYFYAPERRIGPSHSPEWYPEQPRWYVYDVSNPQEIKLVREVSGLTEPMAVSGNYIYAAGSWSQQQNQTDAKFQVINADGQNPTIIGELQFPYTVIFDMDVIDQTVYFSAGNDIRMVDVSNPSLPKLVYSEPGNIGSFADMDVEDNIVVGDLLWALAIETTEDSINVEPFAKLDLDEFRNVMASDIALRDGYVFAATDVGLLIFKLPEQE